MGTAHLILAAAARQRQLDSQRRAREAERRRHNSAERRKKLEEEKNTSKTRTTTTTTTTTSSSYYSYDTKRRYSFEEHLISIIHKDPEFLDYIDSLYEEGRSLDVRDRSKIETELDEVAPQIIAEEKKLEEIRKKIEESGVVLGDRCIIEGVRIDQEGKHPFTYRVGSHNYSFNNFPVQFNGIRVDKDIIETNGAAYEEAYAKERNASPNVEEELEKNRRKLAREQRLLRLPFMDTEKRNKTIENLQIEITRQELALQRITEKKQELDTFRVFTPEQKSLIAEYVNQIYKVKEMSDPAGERVRTYRNIGLVHARTDIIRAKWERANNNLIKSGRVRKDVIDRFYAMIEKELDKVKSSYDEGETVLDCKHSSLGCEGPLAWIIKIKAIEYAREKRDRLLEESKKLDETIELTEKRDDMLGQVSGKEEDGRG